MRGEETLVKRLARTYIEAPLSEYVQPDDKTMLKCSAKCDARMQRREKG